MRVLPFPLPSFVSHKCGNIIRAGSLEDEFPEKNCQQVAPDSHYLPGLCRHGLCRDGQGPMRMDQTLSPGNPPVLHCGVPWPPWHLGLGAGGGLPFQMSELLEDKDSGGWGWEELDMTE